MIAVQLQSKNINVERSDHKGISKYERYYPVTPMIKNGVVQLPRQGSTDLVDQIVNFGSTRHDDLLDAFVYLLQYFVENLLNNRCGVIAVECTGIKEDIDL
jgi:phage terminase large subunit-like protein